MMKQKYKCIWPKKGRNKVSTQVKCLKCNNFLKIWGDEK